ncbi:ATP-binding cassette domain-containing protein [Fulvivirga ligni]|uniref:ATP-binding cassette domain-containing protein n=1 Tax=Fulvivirga ligni TaxID=2904246 RepID=UPI001F1D9819|nr:ABC transporter ATP-binding protein [Fulvivirga ligni]UII22531.1 ABC transporter ATP-binding protein [Fulvivirga ligni]
MIEIKDIKKVYNGTPVLNLPHIEINTNSSVGVVGNNGAGKTTMFRVLLDLILANEGEVILKDVPVKGRDEWKTFTGSFLDEGFLINFLTPDEYFQFVGGLYKLSPADIELSLQRFDHIFNGEIRNQKKYIRDLSKGNQKKVGIAAAFLGHPEIIILDEPFANLDPSTQIKLKKLLIDYKTENAVTYLISSHDLTHVTEVCDRIILLEKGEVIKDIVTTPTTLQELQEYFQQ